MNVATHKGTIFPFEYFEGKISYEDIARFRGNGISHAYASLITGRCGSTLFASLCRNVGFGIGEEPFIEQPFESYEEYTPQEVRRFVERSISEGAIDGRYYFQINPQRYSALKHLFVEHGLSHFISRFSMILRRNIVAQALSFAVATQTGIWHRDEKATAPKDDGKVQITDLQIVEWIEHIHNLELQCFSICREQSQTLVLFYEDIVASPLESLALFLADHGYAPAGRMVFDEIAKDASLRNPPNFSRYQAFMQAYPFFNQVLAARMRGGIPHLGTSEAVARVRAMTYGMQQP